MREFALQRIECNGIGFEKRNRIPRLGLLASFGEESRWTKHPSIADREYWPQAERQRTSDASLRLLMSDRRKFLVHFIKIVC